MAQGEASILVTAQIEELRKLYAELFLLMKTNAQEPAGDPDAGKLAPTIRVLMGEIDEKNEALSERVDLAREQNELDAETEKKIATYREELREGLELMYAHIQKRIAELDAERDLVKSQMRKGVQTRTAAKGYRVANTSPQKIRNTKV